MDELADRARTLDAIDPLAACRRLFTIPEDVVYLDGNSLGALPVAAAARISRAVGEEWGVGLVGSWNSAGWYELPLRLGDRLGALLGVAPGQVAVCDTTTVNLFKALAAALAMRPERSTMVMDHGDFPANLYVAEGALLAAGRPIERRLLADDEQPAVHLDEQVAVVALSHVSYRSGRIRDIAGITRAAHDAGALVIWDLCHSAGVLPLRLDDWQVDFAVGCAYKYLNGGPGAPGWIYVASRHLEVARQPLSGWMGHAAPFDFEPGYRPAPGIRRFLCGTPHVLSLRGVEAGLDTYDGVDIEAVRAKSIALTELFAERVEERVRSGSAGRRGTEIRMVSPRAAAERGSQVALAFADGHAVVRAMIERGVIGDFRAPDVMRFGFQPLYLSHTEAIRAADVLAGCMRDEVWTEERFLRRAVVT